MSSKKPGTGKKKVGVKKAQKFQSSRADDLVEDLDLDVDEYFPEEAMPTTFDGKEEERVVLNKKKAGRKVAEDSEDEDADVHAVLPNDAHRGVHANEDEDGAVEEAAMALAKSKKARKGLSDDDFALDGVAPITATKASSSNAKASAAAIESALETVQRDLTQLSSADRRALLEKESPEVIKLLEEYKTYLAEVTKVSKPLHEMIHSKKVTSAEERNLLAFLETKAQLLLSYCMHVSFYLLLKAEGKPVANHPVIDRLVELRVYIEKLWPLEQKLQYSLNKLIAQGPTAGAGAGVKLGDLRPVSVEEGALYKPAGAKLGDDDAKQRRLARRQMQEDEELRQAEEEAMVRVQKKKGKAIDASFLEHAAEDGYREDDDQFFSRMVADEDSEDGSDDEGAHLSLIEKLRAKADAKKAKKTAATKRARDEVEEEDDEEDMDGDDAADFDDEDDDMLSDMDEEGEEDDDAYEQLLEENRAIKRQKDSERAERDAATARYEKGNKSLDRRKISKSITTHRGLTKVRPKDRKTPHLAQRHKYDKGLAKAKNMSKSFKPEAAGGFAGVSGFRSNVTHGTKL